VEGGLPMQIYRTLSALALGTAALCGCGTYVPNIQDFGDTVDGQLLVGEIVENINCEIGDAVQFIKKRDLELAPANGGKLTAAWFDDWGIQTTLVLTMDEKGTLNPVVNWLPPSPVSSVFNLSGSATLSSDANRVDKLNSFNTVKEFQHRQCNRHREGPLLLQSDLKLREWLTTVIFAANTGGINVPPNANGPFKSSVITHEVKFDIMTSGSLTPGWKLKRVLINQSGNLLTASRDRTHDLTITLGPVAPVVVGQKTKTDKQGRVLTDSNGKPVVMLVYQLAPTAAATDAHLASEIGSAVASAIKSTLAQ
jgi:hypothetical protein